MSSTRYLAFITTKTCRNIFAASPIPNNTKIRISSFSGDKTCTDRETWRSHRALLSNIRYERVKIDTWTHSWRRSGTAQSVQRLATGWTVQGSNPGGEARSSAPVQIGPGAHPALHNGYRVSTTGKAAGVWLDYPPHLALRLKKE
jgi:hypothetical protein